VAVSDEKRESILWMGFNTGTGAALGDGLARLRAALGDQSWQAPDPAVRAAAGPVWDAAHLEARVRPMLDAAVRAELAPFLRSMQRRLGRDQARLHGYHDCRFPRRFDPGFPLRTDPG
jgi:Ser/Thr protein kinase RdoA (MazF antagonist)